MTTYDIYFSDGSSSDNKGFSIKTPEKAIHMAEDMLVKGNSYIENPGADSIFLQRSGCSEVMEPEAPERGPEGIFVHVLSKTYILHFQGRTQLRQFCCSGQCNTQKTAARISGASHKNVRHALPALLL